MSIALHIGDCRAVLATLPAASVHCVVTSPPYWGLRDYGTATWEGGDPGCDHQAPAGKSAGQRADRAFTLGEIYRENCGKCGAIRIDAQLGLEPDFNAYVANMAGVFREVRRVLRDDGTLWLNLGDSYATSVNGRSAADTKAAGNDDRTFRDKPFSTIGGVLKAKDICGIPWRVAFALQADGWYLRQDIIWAKPNPMPESVTDRCTKAHEYLFLLSKRERYYYDADAIREPGITTAEEAQSKWAARRNGVGKGQQEGVYHSYKDVKPFQNDPNPLGRNKRSVWEVTTQPFSEAHFATFPPALIEPCIKAGCPVGGTVLDPFSGAGTTGLVADRLQRNAVLIELNPAYAAMSSNRIKDDAPLFAEVAQP